MCLELEWRIYYHHMIYIMSISTYKNIYWTFLLNGFSALLLAMFYFYSVIDQCYCSDFYSFDTLNSLLHLNTFQLLTAGYWFFFVSLFSSLIKIIHFLTSGFYECLEAFLFIFQCCYSGFLFPLKQVYISTYVTCSLNVIVVKYF